MSPCQTLLNTLPATLDQAGVSPRPQRLTPHQHGQSPQTSGTGLQIPSRRRALPLMLLAALLAGCAKPAAPEIEPRPVRTTAVHFQTSSTSARYSGEIRARYETSLSFQVNGHLVSRLVDVGAQVTRGQLLATLDPADYRLDVASAAAQVEAAEADLAQARKDLRHLDNLEVKALASPAAVERRQDQLHAAEARVAAARAVLGSRARQSGYTELRADRDGVITAISAETGQVIAAGQAILRLAQTGEKEVVISVPENRLDTLKSASAIDISLWAYPERMYRGQVREVSPGVDALLRTFTAKISLKDADERVAMGMTATAEVKRDEPRPIAWIPLTAVTRLAGASAAWVYDPASSTVQPRTVTVASFDEDSAKLVDGLHEGERVVTAGVHKLVAGQKVRLLETDSP